MGRRGRCLGAGAARYPRRGAGMTELFCAGVTEVFARVCERGRAGVREGREGVGEAGTMLGCWRRRDTRGGARV